MANKSDRRRKMAAKKRAEKKARMAQPGMKSTYALKQREPVGERLRRREGKRRAERAPGEHQRMVRHRMVPEGDQPAPEPRPGRRGSKVIIAGEPPAPESRLPALDRWRLALYGPQALEKHALWGRP